MCGNPSKHLEGKKNSVTTVVEPANKGKFIFLPFNKVGTLELIEVSGPLVSFDSRYPDNHVTCAVVYKFFNYCKNSKKDISGTQSKKKIQTLLTMNVKFGQTPTNNNGNDNKDKEPSEPREHFGFSRRSDSVEHNN